MSLLTAMLLLGVGPNCLSAQEERKSPEAEKLHYMHRDEFGGKCYTSKISGDVYAGMSDWNFASREALPVAPQEILKVGENYVRQLGLPEGLVQLEDLAIHPVGGDPRERKCVWRITFREDKPGPQSTLQLLVTMDGDLIEPVITEEKPAERE